MEEIRDHVCCFGEVLWDLLPSGKLLGGAPMNVALHLRNLGIEVAMISNVGSDSLGDELLNFMNKKNCATKWIQRDTIHGTGVVEVNVTNRTAATYTIVYPVAWDFITASPEALDAAKNAFAFVYGTLASRDLHSRSALLTLLDSSTGLKIYDVNLRPPHYTQELVEILLQRADIVKMNEEELDTVGKWIGLHDLPTEEKANRIKAKFGLQSVIITLGGNGAQLLDATGFYQSKVYKVDVVDTIGSGDSFLAGMIKNIYLNHAPEYSLNYACALGALVATHPGANPAIKESEILKMMAPEKAR